MVIVSYDISNDKIRTKFSKYLSKFGYRLQYSVFKIENSPRLLANVISEIHEKYEPNFGENDSIIIYNLSQQCKIQKYGYARHEDEEIIFVD